MLTLRGLHAHSSRACGRRRAACHARPAPHALHATAGEPAQQTAQEAADEQYTPSQGWKVGRRCSSSSGSAAATRRALSLCAVLGACCLQRQRHHPTKAQLWEIIRREAWTDAACEPALASILYSTVLSHTRLENTLAFLLANKLACNSLGSVQLMSVFQDAFDSDPTIVDAAVADMLAVRDRDPACDKYSQCMLYFKGYQAIQCHRVAHWLWKQGRIALAFALQSRVSEGMHVDIHPAVPVGSGVLLDHATGVVIGETAQIGDNVSMLHHVTLGGSGKGKGVRHPNIGNGVLLGAGSAVLGPVTVGTVGAGSLHPVFTPLPPPSLPPPMHLTPSHHFLPVHPTSPACPPHPYKGSVVLGPVTVGAGSKVGAGSVVLSELPPHSVAVGVPARVIKREDSSEPVADMDQTTDFLLDYII